MVILISISDVLLPIAIRILGAILVLFSIYLSFNKIDEKINTKRKKVEGSELFNEIRIIIVMVGMFFFGLFLLINGDF